MNRQQILTGDCREILPTLEPQSVQCCVTSPPYWGLRDYGTNGQLGLETTPQEYIAKMVAVFREVWRVLKPDATLWLNLGDSYAGSSSGDWREGNPDKNGGVSNRNGLPAVVGLRPKELCGIPWRLAFALQADGWYLRSDIIWHKPNPMPESVTDRPTRAHEYIFLLSKAERYFYDAEAIKEPLQESTLERGYAYRDSEYVSAKMSGLPSGEVRANGTWHGKRYVPAARNKRSVWTIPTQPYPEAHFATFPEEIPKLCILAGSKPGDTILDPFAGSGTVSQVALELGRRAILIELNPDYIKLARDRTFVTPGFL